MPERWTLPVRFTTDNLYRALAHCTVLMVASLALIVASMAPIVAYLVHMFASLALMAAPLALMVAPFAHMVEFCSRPSPS